MVGRKSWAEGPWWKRAQHDPLGLVIFVVAAVFGLPAFLLWHIAVPPLQRYYADTYQAGCVATPRGPIALPYVEWANGGWTLASVAQVVSLPPTPAGMVRFNLSTAAIATGARRLQFVRISGPAAAGICVALKEQIRWNAASSLLTYLPRQVAGAMFLIGLALIVTACVHQQTGRTMRRGHTLRGPELVKRRRFNRLKRGDGIGFVTRDTRSLTE